jgi:SET domain-containing protein
MILVSTYLSSSPIEGLGLFAKLPIQKGAVVWKFVPRIDALLTKEEVNALPTITRELCLRYAYYVPVTGKYVLCGDDARFVNHSDTPNTAGAYPEGDPYGIDIAIRDIDAGEEITCDYRSFDPEVSYKFGVSPRNYIP